MAPNSLEESLSFQSTHPTKITGHTNHILAVLGWQTIEFPKSVETLWEQLAQLDLGQSEDGGQKFQDHRGPRSDSESEQGKPEIAEEARLLAEDPTTPWLEDKYFDHYGYLNYLQGPNKKPITIRAACKVRKPKHRKKAQTKKSTKKQNIIHRDHDARPPRTNTAADSTEKASTDTQLQEQIGEWELQSGTTDPPCVSITSPSHLTITLVHKATNTTHKFVSPSSTLSHESIDWKLREHMTLIAQWRHSIFTQYNILLKRGHVLYSEDEDAWFQLFHAKLRGVIDAGTLTKIPGPVPVTEAFNAYFADEPSNDADGEGDGTGVRPARGFDTIRGKLENKSGKLVETRKTLRELVDNRRNGFAYIPVIVPEELSAYRYDGTVVVDDPYEERKNAAAGRRSKVGSPKRKRQSSEEDGRNEKGEGMGKWKKMKTGSE